MAYGPKFRIEGSSPDGHDYRADIEQEGYSGSVTEFTPAPDGLQLRWDTQSREDLNEPWMIGTGSIRVKEEDPSPLAEIFDGGTFEYRVRLYQDGTEYFVGFAQTDLYEDSLWKFLSDPRIRFTDGLGKLSDIAFQQAGSEEDVREALIRALDLLPNDLKSEVNMRWFPNGISSYPIEKLYVPDEAWHEDDTETAPNPTPKRKSGRAVLRSLLRRFGMRLMQSGGKWRMRQRLSLLDDSLEVATYNQDGTRASSGTKTGRERDLTNFNVDEESRSFQGEFGASSVQYTFKTPLEQVLPNPGFEDSFTKWTTTGDAQRVDIDTVSDRTKTSGNSKAVKMTTSDAKVKLTDAIEIPQDPRIQMTLQWADIRDTVQGGVAVHSDSHGLAYETVKIDAPALPGEETTLELLSTVGSTTGSVQGTPLMPAGAELRIFTSDPSVSPIGNRFTLSEPLRVGDQSITGNLAQEIKKEGDVDLKPELQYWFWAGQGYQFTNTRVKDYFTRHSVQVFMVTRQANPVHGSLMVQWRVKDAANVGYYAVDDVSMDFERDGEQIESFTTTVVDEDGSRELQEVPVGIGPTERSGSRIYTQSNETPEGWGRGSSGSSTLSELQATESLQMQRTSPETRQFRLRLRSGDDDILPHHIYLDGSKRYEAIALRRDLLQGTARLNLAEIQDDGTSGLSTTTSFEGEDTTASGGGGSSVQVLQGSGSGASAWDDISGKPDDLFARTGGTDSYAGTVPLKDTDINTALGYTPADETTSLTAGTGLTGGGDLSADRTLSITDGGVDTLQLASNAVTRAKIGDAAVGKTQIGTDAVGPTKVDSTVASGYPIDITGDADTVDGYEGSDLAALTEDESVTGSWDFQTGMEIYATGRHLDLIETDENDKRWRFEVQGEDFAITEDNVALHFRIKPGGDMVAENAFTAGGDVSAGGNVDAGGSLLQSGNQAAIVTNDHSITGTWDHANPLEWSANIDGVGYEGYFEIPIDTAASTEYVLISELDTAGTNQRVMGTLYFGRTTSSSVNDFIRAEFYYNEDGDGDNTNFYLETTEDKESAGGIDARLVELDWNGNRWAAIEMVTGFGSPSWRAAQLGITGNYDKSTIQARAAANVSNVTGWSKSTQGSYAERRFPGPVELEDARVTKLTTTDIHVPGGGEITVEHAGGDDLFKINSDGGNTLLEWDADEPQVPVEFGVGIKTTGQLGVQTDPSYPLDVNGDGRVTGRLHADSGLTSAGDVDPDSGYAYNIGSSQDKWLTVNAAELRVSTLVAEKELATVGGRQLVGTANELTQDLGASDTAIDVKYNNLQDGDILRLEAGGKVEFMEVGVWIVVGTDTSNNYVEVNGDRTAYVSAGEEIYLTPLSDYKTVDSVTYDEGGSGNTRIYVGSLSSSQFRLTRIRVSTNEYRYLNITRALDNTSANSWDQGDGLFSTSTGEGFIDLYAEHSFTDAAQSTITGPTIEFRERASSDYDDVPTRAAVGNLHSTFDYTADVYGIAAGDPSGTWIAADADNGFRAMDGTTKKIGLDTNGDAFFSGEVQAQSGDFGGWSIQSDRIESSSQIMELRSSKSGSGQDTIFLKDSTWFVTFGNPYTGSWKTSEWGFALQNTSAGGGTVVELSSDNRQIASWSIASSTISSGPLTLDAGTPVITTEDGSGNLRAAFGNLTGSYGYGSDVYGLAAGDPSAENITVDATNGLRLRDGTTDLAQLTGSELKLGANDDLVFDGSAGTIKGDIGIDGKIWTDGYELTSTGLRLEEGFTQVINNETYGEDASSIYWSFEANPVTDAPTNANFWVGITEQSYGSGDLKGGRLYTDDFLLIEHGEEIESAIFFGSTTPTTSNILNITLNGIPRSRADGQMGATQHQLWVDSNGYVRATDGGGNPPPDPTT